MNKNNSPVLSLSVEMPKSYVFAYLLFFIFIGIKEVQFVRSTCSIKLL